MLCIWEFFKMRAGNYRFSRIEKELPILYEQTSLHQESSVSKIPWEYSGFREKNAFSDQNWTLLILLAPYNIR